MKVYLRTFGCRANRYDSEGVRAMVEGAGGTIVDAPDEADVAVFNSCAVTSEAEADLRKSVRHASRARPGLRSVVMGCAAAIDRGTIAALPSVDRVVAGADFAGVAVALGLGADANPVAIAQSGTRALLRIQDGCDEHCTFCATTVARGANRSRPIDVLVHEAAALAERHAELVLTGVHIGTYGRDTDSSLGALVERLVRAVPGARFRLTSIEATEVDARLEELFAEPAHVAPHLHAPLQSGADRILKRMGRHWYTAGAYASAVERIAARHTRFGLGADVIAGFPGETEEDHRATVAFVESLPFTYLHVFPFSLRPGTAAERLPGRLDGAVVSRRARELREVAERKRLSYVRSRAGGSADIVVVRGPEREGLTEDYLTVTMSAAHPRGARVAATLAADGDRLVATARPAA